MVIEDIMELYLKFILIILEEMFSVLKVIFPQKQKA
jgi:hypothetical protein